MNRLRHIFLLIILIVSALGGGRAVMAQSLNDKLFNRPYADMRKWHLGFSIGLHTQDLRFTHNGFVTDDGETWFMDQPSYSPGFCVNGLLDLRLNNYFSLRFTPGLYFGNRNVKMVNTSGDINDVLSQNIRSTFVVLPIDLKFNAVRYRNVRPYMLGGVMPAFDVSKKKRDMLKLNSSDFYLSLGFGCDFYLPFFKLASEVKFCFGLTDVLRHDRPDLEDDPASLKFTQSLSKATSKMVVFTLYFE